MSIYKKLAVAAVVLLASGVVEVIAMQSRGAPPVMMPPSGGRRGGAPTGGTGARRGAPPPAPGATAARVEKKNYTFKETNQKIEYNVFASTKVNKKNKTPLVVALHGLNEPPMMVMRFLTDAAEEAGYIVAAPMGYNQQSTFGANGPSSPEMTPANLGELSEKDVMNVLDLVRKQYTVDENRIYLVGQSTGGGGALHLAMKYPEIWAAVAAAAPVIPNPDPNAVSSLKTMPVMLIHGSADETVPVEQSRKYVEKMRELKMVHEYIEIPGAVHADAMASSATYVFAFFDKHTKAGGAGK